MMDMHAWTEEEGGEDGENEGQMVEGNDACFLWTEKTEKRGVTVSPGSGMRAIIGMRASGRQGIGRPVAGSGRRQHKR